MKLYDFAFSPNCRKVRAVAYELGVELDHAPVDLIRGESRSPGIVAKNPNGKVPIFEDGDFVLWESNAIIAYLAATYGKGALLPSAPRERAEVDRWLLWQVGHLAPAAGKVAYERVVKKLTKQGPPDEKAVAEGAAEFARLTGVLETTLSDGREYVAGRLSVADFALASHYSLAEACALDLSPFPRVRAWLERVCARDSMKRALADARAAA